MISDQPFFLHVNGVILALFVFSLMAVLPVAGRNWSTRHISFCGNYF